MYPRPTPAKTRPPIIFKTREFQEFETCCSARAAGSKYLLKSLDSSYLFLASSNSRGVSLVRRNSYFFSIVVIWAVYWVLLGFDKNCTAFFTLSSIINNYLWMGLVRIWWRLKKTKFAKSACWNLSLVSVLKVIIYLWFIILLTAGLIAVKAKVSEESGSMDF